MISKTVYFMQHGLALSKDENPDRPLSATGIKETTAIARHLGQTTFSPSKMYHSGKLRAQQTAEIIAQSTGLAAGDLTQHAHLSPNDDIQLLLPQLQHDALYVGHLPHLDKLCTYLLTGNNDTGRIRFRNSAVLCLAHSENTWQLNWLLPPEIIPG